MQVRIEVPLPVTVETFWDRLFFDPEYNQGLYQALGFQAFEVLSQETLPDGRIRRVVRAEPPVKGPEILKKKLSSRLSYIDDGVYDPRTRVWSFRNESNVSKESSKISGTIRAEPAHGGCTEIIDVDLTVRAFGLGALAERVIESNMRESYRAIAAYLHQFAAARGLLAT